jgi:hypothetical protein
VCENKVLRRIFGPDRENMVGCLKRLHNVFHNLHTLRKYLGWHVQGM